MRCVLVAIGLCGCGVTSTPAPAPTKEQLGKLLFEDPNLSSPPGSACSSCHDPKQAFREPESDFATSMGAVQGRFGPRNTPTVLYARYIPPLQYDEARGGWFGGLFDDGRVSTLEEQAEKPLLNPLEMNNADKAAVVATVRRAGYAGSFTAVFGPRALDDADAGFAHVTEALAAYERTATFAPFASKYDDYLAHRVELAPAEARGLAIFEDPARGNCATCHPSRPSADGTPPLFTTFGYANLGIPKYLNNPFFADEPAMNPDGAAYIDHGLMETVADPAQDGKFRIPTLRDVARTPPYGHAGYFENLPYMLEFLATRDGYGPNGAWAGPEIAATVDQRVGHLPLTDADLGDLHAFLSTLSDP